MSCNTFIKNEVRYAAVRADSLHLHTVFITRKAFETALGVPLERLVPDHYLDESKLPCNLRDLHIKWMRWWKRASSKRISAQAVERPI